MTSGASAPGKIILFGEHFVVHGTRAILAAIDRRVTVVSSIIDESVIRIESALGSEEMDVSGSGTVPELRPFEFLAKRMIREFSHAGGIDIKIISEIPHGVGLGSSSASCVAAAASISGLFTRNTREEICRLAVEAERTIFKNTSGADCTVCTHGGIITYGRDSGFERSGETPGFQLIVSNSGLVHSTEKVVARVAEFKKRYTERFNILCEKESALVRTVTKHIRDRDSGGIGIAMKENQVYLEEIGVSSDALREIIRYADSHSLGSKITGAGGGGCIISVTDEPSPDHIIKKMQGYGIHSFGAKIDHTGLETF